MTKPQPSELALSGGGTGVNADRHRSGFRSHHRVPPNNRMHLTALESLVMPPVPVVEKMLS
jgi:hypothetical protein